MKCKAIVRWSQITFQYIVDIAVDSIVVGARVLENENSSVDHTASQNQQADQRQIEEDGEAV